MMKIPKRSLFIFTLMAILLLCFSATAAVAVTVTNTQDYDSTEDPVEGSLRWALDTVEDGGTISFDIPDLPGVISLDQQLVISESVTIEGPGVDQLALSGGPTYRIIGIPTGTPAVIMSGLSFTNGNGYRGGAISHESGNLTISSSDFTGNTTRIQAHGGAIYSTGDKLTVNNCSFTNNIGMSGGAIYVDTNSASEVNINSSYFSANSSNQYGGALYLGYGGLDGNEVNIKIENSEFHNNVNNTAGYAGGAIYVLGPFLVDNLQILSCNFSDNVSSGSGGAINCSGTDNAVIEKSYFSNNSSNSYGGAIYLNKVISADINSCVLSGNNSENYDGGGIYSRSDSDSNSIISLRNSTINGNSANYGGGIAVQSYGTFNLLNCTIAGNSASGNGGGIKNPSNSSSINISNCTIYGNSRETSDQYGNAISNSGTMNLKNTIVACNTDGDGTTDNQIYNGSGSSFTKDFSITSNDIVSSDLFSGGLADNGGPYVGVTGNTVPLLTLSLKPSSPAIDSASSTDIFGNVVSTDQRGKPRPSPEGGSFDIGAFELQQEPIETFTITTTHTEGGSITTDSDAENSASNYFIPAGESITFEITSDNGYYISQINVDEEPYYTHLSFQKVITEDTYTFDNVSEDHTLSATFAAEDDPVDPVDPDEPNLEGGTCNVGAFTPLAGLLVLPLLFLFKK